MSESPIELQVIPISPEVPDNFAKELSGRMVTFGEGENIAWGIEVDIPVTADVKNYLANYDIELPQSVLNIKFLTLSPQESLTPEQRTIRSSRTHESMLQLMAETTKNLNTLTKNGERPYEYLARELIKVLPTNEDRQKFQNATKNSQATGVVIVQGHGGDGSRSIGEQYSDIPRNSEGVQLQRAGNTVLVDELLKKYDDSSLYSAILLESCYTGSDELKAKSVPVFYINGISSLTNSLGGRNKAMTALPAA